MKSGPSIIERRSIRRDVSYFVKRWILRRPFLIADLESIGLVFKVKTEDVIGRHIYKYHAHEPDIGSCLVEHLDPQPGDVFIDVGANIGWYSVLFDSIAQPGTSIFAFEPDPLNCSLLRTNLEMNRARFVEVIEAAVAENSGRSRLYRYGSNNLGRHSLLDIESRDSIDVATVSLDDFWDQNNLDGRTVRLLKIDIEGYECLALKSAIKVLENCSLVISEFDPFLIGKSGLDPEAQFDLFEHAGLRPALLNDGRLEAVSRETLLSKVHGVNVFWRRDPGKATQKKASELENMAAKVDLYNTYYDKFAADAQALVRAETYGEDIGQSSWMTADELRHFIDLLKIGESSKVLEIGSGSGGPALFLAKETGCRLTGVDVNEFGIKNSNELSKEQGLSERAEFKLIDASKPLPFEDGTFDVVFSNDVMCHVPERQRVLREWHRVLKPGGRMLFTDALVISGIVSHEEIAKRSSIGLYFYLPLGENERMIEEAGFEIITVEDLTSAAADISKRWHDAREKHRDAMIKIEGEENFAGLQDFLSCVHTLTSERRLSRFAYYACKT